MKNMMKYFSLAVLALTVTVLAGCQKDETLTGDGVHFTATVKMAGGGTKALAANGHKTFAVGDQIAVVYKNTSGATVKAVSAALTPSDIKNNGKAANFSVELTDPDRSLNVTYIYPASMAKDDGSVNYDALATQNGTRATLSSSLDLCTYSGSWSGGSLPTNVTMTNQLAICKFAVLNSSETVINNTITNLIISDGTHTYTVNRSASIDSIWVAMHPVTSGNIAIIASDGTNFYEKSFSGKTLTAGHIHPIAMKMDAGHPYVDLGLPSGRLWATCNVGATNPQDYGNYFAWGETTPKANYAWTTYAFDNSTNHDGSSFSKYTGSDYSVLQPADDAATQNWGSNWRMATSAEWAELVSNTDKEWTTIGGVQGGKFMKKTDHSVYIFLPAGGLLNETGGTWGHGSNGRYWSSSLKTDEPARAFMTSCDNNEDRPYDASYRHFGRSVRAVLSWN